MSTQVQRLRAARKRALQDCALQLRLKAGQVEVCAGPTELCAPDEEQALLIHRQRVEGLNVAVKAKVCVMTHRHTHTPPHTLTHAHTHTHRHSLVR